MTHKIVENYMHWTGESARLKEKCIICKNPASLILNRVVCGSLRCNMIINNWLLKGIPINDYVCKNPNCNKQIDWSVNDVLNLKIKRKSHWKDFICSWNCCLTMSRDQRRELGFSVMPVRICQFCDNKFLTQGTNRVFCQASCRESEYKQKWIKDNKKHNPYIKYDEIGRELYRICKHCNNHFERVVGFYSYCGIECQQLGRHLSKMKNNNNRKLIATQILNQHSA